MELTMQGGGTLSLNDDVFGKPYNEGLVHQIVTAYLAGGRQGSKAQKTRSEVSGGGAKPWRQKGTGRARAGTIRSPIWTGGGVTFAARPRDYSQKVNKKMYRAALRSILSNAAANGTLVVVESLELAEPRTRLMKQKLAELGITRALVLVDEVTQNLWMAGRNVPHIQILDVDGVDPVSLVRHSTILTTTGALRRLEERLA